jgi:hypothetical protein
MWIEAFATLTKSSWPADGQHTERSECGTSNHDPTRNVDIGEDVVSADGTAFNVVSI